MNWYGLEIDDKLKQLILWRSYKKPSSIESGKRLLITSSGPLIFSYIRVFNNRSRAVTISSFLQKVKYQDYILLIK